MDIKNETTSNDFILIRKVRKDDAKQYIKLINSVGELFIKIFFQKKYLLIEKKKQRTELKALLINSIMIMCYVAECKGIIVGAINGTIKSTYEHFLEGDFADLVGLYINPNYQGKGIGTKLKNIFEDWARKNGARKYIIGVLKDNNNARKIYESWGGELDNWEQKFYKLDVGYDEVFYKYNL